MTDFSLYDDRQLLALLKEGGEGAFTEIYKRYWQKLFYVVHKRIASSDDTKEIVQQVFLNLWEKRASLQIESLPVYLAAMARYATYRHWANEQRRESHLKIVHEQKKQVTPAFDLDSKQFLDILTKFAGTLPEKYRLVFISHKLLDRPLEEVAEQLGVSPRTAEGYVSKLMEIMRNHREKIAFSLLLPPLL